MSVSTEPLGHKLSTEEIKGPEQLEQFLKEHTPEFKKAAYLLRSIGSTRLQILRLIFSAPEGKIKIPDIEKEIGITPQTIDYHLRHLEASEIVLMQKEGPVYYYKLNPNLMAGSVRRVLPWVLEVDNNSLKKS